MDELEAESVSIYFWIRPLELRIWILTGGTLIVFYFYFGRNWFLVIGLFLKQGVQTTKANKIALLCTVLGFILTMVYECIVSSLVVVPGEPKRIENLEEVIKLEAYYIVIGTDNVTVGKKLALSDYKTIGKGGFLPGINEINLSNRSSNIGNKRFRNYVYFY